MQKRGLKSQVPGKRYLVQCLEAVDDAEDARNARKVTQKLHRFSELPPELRNRIYILYFESLGEVPPRFVLPPLCRASRQLRSETTGLFFEHGTLVIWLKHVILPWNQRLPTQLFVQKRAIQEDICSVGADLRESYVSRLPMSSRPRGRVKL